MKENKNLDKLFQEKFKSLDYQPQEIVWENIEERLKEKKKRRVIPFWWKLSGIAAILVFGLGLYNVIDNNNSGTNSVVDSNNNSINSTNSSNNKNESNDRIIKNYNDAIVLDEERSKNNDSQVKISEEEKENTSKNNVLKNKKTNSGIASSNRNENKSSDKTVNENRIIVTNSKVEMSENESENNRNYSNSIKNNYLTIANNQFENNTKISDNFNNDKKIVNNKIENKIASIENNKDITKNIEDIKKIDTTSIASVVPNAMEELLNEKEKKTIKEQKLNRWQLSSNVAPIYFSSSSNGSPLDSKFKDNTKQFNINLGYGIGVKYAVNKKIKIRTGVNSLVADYNTNDVVAYQNVNASKIEHVDSNLRGSIIQVESKLESQTTLQLNDLQLNKYDSSLNQKIGYIEVPLELSYKIVDKKFGVEVIGGVSSLFLNQNEVSVITSGTEMIIGKANNLNSFHFSGNLGLGLKYNIWKKIEAHLEPIFKYQVNTFNNDSGNFKPYIFGVYSGLSYTF